MHRHLRIVLVLVVAASLSFTAPAAAVDKDKLDGTESAPVFIPDTRPERTRIYDPYTPDLRNERHPTSGYRERGQTASEYSRGGWVHTEELVKQRKKSGFAHPETVGVKGPFKNANIGKKATIVPQAFLVKNAEGRFEVVHVRSLAELAKLVEFREFGVQDPATGLYQIRGYEFNYGESGLGWMSPAALSEALFKLTGGQFTECRAKNGHLGCDFSQTYTVRAGHLDRHGLTGDLTEHVGPPICTGTVVDGALGVTTRIRVEDVGCQSEEGHEISRLLVEYVLVEPSYGTVATDSDGSLVFTPTAASEGEYIPMQVWALTNDGHSSWPFWVVVRTRYAPQSTAPATIEAIRGAEVTMPVDSLFRDVDVDEHQAESGDHLTYTIVNPGTVGGAWIDGSGILHYRSIDVLAGPHSDDITVRATDAYGASAEARIRIPITEVRPGCANTGTTTDTNTPVHLVTNCWLDAPPGYTGANLAYTVAALPEHGTVTSFDPVSGAFTYIPDPDRPGIYTVSVTASNNGAHRDSQHTIHVLSGP